MKWYNYIFLIYIVSGIILIISFLLTISLGAVVIPVRTVWGVMMTTISSGTVVEDWPVGHAAIVLDLRLPRAFLAVLVGAGLALTGTVLQAVTRNPLADPHLLGISSGAAFGAILALLHTGLFLGLATVPFLAFLGALAATFLVLGIARAAQAMSAERMVLAGVAVSFIIMALANFLIFLGDPRASHMAIFWMLGGLGLVQWSHLIWPILVLVPAAGWLLRHAEDLNAMTLGDETAVTLGIPAERFRLLVFTASAVMTGTMVAFSGIIGFVGLMVPHIMRMIVGGDHTRLIPAVMLAGAVLLLWSDLLARLLLAPEDLPIGVVTGLLGGVFFLWLLRRGRI
ncbi:MAG: FecCD family ABC transporter permease [Pseudorhodobacter sp.]